VTIPLLRKVRKRLERHSIEDRELVWGMRLRLEYRLALFRHPQLELSA
jgi:hypothetical protein